MWRRFWIASIAGLVLISTVSPSAADTVYVVPIKGTIEKGLAAFISRVMEDAEEEGDAE